MYMGTTMPVHRFVLFLTLTLSLFSSLVSSQKSKSPWLTLSGDAPVVIAKGGFSGLLPDSSLPAYQLAILLSLPDVILWCDVQLTKDNHGICAPSLNLANGSNIDTVFPNAVKTYMVNGVPEDGYFPVDYTLKDLSNVFLVQGIYSRPFQFDAAAGNLISTVEQVVQQSQPPRFWLNIQHDQFYSQHNLSMRIFVISASRRVIINYISSPEVSFLRSIAARFRTGKTKLIFRFLEADATEPSTNQTYESLLKNFTFIKTFASGILIPKSYIWPADANQYLQPHTSVVSDAHKAGLEVYASDFANDGSLSYNYSYDPVKESLSYIDNGDFSVDGMLTSFPLTQSQAIGCFANMKENSSGERRPIIVSHNGASGVYTGCTDLAYQRAVDDGADIIDCAVQITKDGVPICLGSVNLIDNTNVIQSRFASLLTKIPELLEGASGIFTFNLTWSDIQTLKPSIHSPFVDFRLIRNPAYANAGKFMTLADFLTFAKDKRISGILINIEHAAFLAEKQGLSVADSVLNALQKAGYDNQTHLGVTIQSPNVSVLNKFKKTKYSRMYLVDEIIGGAVKSSIEDIKSAADSVAIRKVSIYPVSKAFTVRSTDIVKELKSNGLKVYAYYFRNEFVSQAWDFFSDPSVEINSYFQGADVDGIITDYPETANRYRNNACLKMDKNMPNFMRPVQPGGLLQLMSAGSLPPALAPLPVLKDSDVEEPALPPASVNPQRSGPRNASAPTSPPNGVSCNAASHVVMSLIMLLVASLLI